MFQSKLYTNVVRTIFLLALAFHAVWQAMFMFQLSFMPDALMERNGVPIEYLPNLAGQYVLASAGQGLLVVLSILSIVWAVQSKSSGYVLGVVLGLYFLPVGIALWAVAGEPSMYAQIDIARGIVTIVFGALAWPHRAP